MNALSFSVDSGNIIGFNPGVVFTTGSEANRKSRNRETNTLLLHKEYNTTWSTTDYITTIYIV